MAVFALAVSLLCLVAGFYQAYGGHHGLAGVLLVTSIVVSYAAAVIARRAK